MARRIFSLQKENDFKVQLRFVKCCTLVVTEGCHILLSPLKRLVRCHFIMFRMYIMRTSWNTISGKGSVASVNGAAGFESLRRGFRCGAPWENFWAVKSIWIGLTIQEKLRLTQFSTRMYWNRSLATDVWKMWFIK